MSHLRVHAFVLRTVAVICEAFRAEPAHVAPLTHAGLAGRPGGGVRRHWRGRLEAREGEGQGAGVEGRWVRQVEAFCGGKRCNLRLLLTCGE